MFNFCIGQDVTASGSIIGDEAYLSYLIAHGSGTVTVRNGIDVTGDIIFKATVGGTTSQYFPFAYPIKAKDGIYIELGAGVTATIGYFG